MISNTPSNHNPNFIKQTEEMKSIENCFSISVQKLQGKTKVLSERFFASHQESRNPQSAPSLLLELCEGCLILYDNDGKQKGGVPFNQATKFEMHFADEDNVKSQMIGLKILFSGKEASLYSSNQLAVRMWWNNLISKITYNGFMKLFQRSIKIGQGAFSSVYLATFLIEDRRVALKCVQKEDLDDDTTRKKSFFSEIQTMRKLNHENVNKLYGVFESEKTIYQAIELIDCGQLTYRFKSNYKFSSFEIKLIMQSLLKGLKHIHSKRIMHRDIKPENIMFRTKSTDSEVVIVDFGLAVFCDSNDYIWYRCGTPGYIAPEILTNKSHKKLDPVVDIFSVGAIFYRLLFGKPLFHGKSHNQVLALNISCQFQFVEIDSLNTFTTATLDLLMKMLDVNPVTRITAEEALTHPFFSQNTIFKTRSRLTIQPLKICIEQQETDSPRNKNNFPVRTHYSQEKFKKFIDRRANKNFSPKPINISPQHYSKPPEFMN